MNEKRINPDIETCNLILVAVDTLQECADKYMNEPMKIYYKGALGDVREIICKIVKYAYPDRCLDTDNTSCEELK